MDNSQQVNGPISIHFGRIDICFRKAQDEPNFFPEFYERESKTLLESSPLYAYFETFDYWRFCLT